MARRKKEPEGVHREHISAAAERLFMQKGILSTTMDEIAREAGYSKATLYVYFRDKDALAGYLVLKSMTLLYDCICAAVERPASFQERYLAVCHALAEYQARYPFYFDLALGEINVDFDRADGLPEERETYLVGERINQVLFGFLRDGMEAGAFRAEIQPLPAVFLFWSALAGVIRMAANKQAYLEQAAGLTQDVFLEYGFLQLYRIIMKEDFEK